MGAPLEGLRVVELARILAGPWIGQTLADLGAEVIKLEPPQGDDYRHIGPFKDGESAYFATLNRGKQSIALDLRAARRTAWLDLDLGNGGSGGIAVGTADSAVSIFS